MMWGWGCGGPGAFGWMGGLLMWIFPAALIGLVVWLATGRQRRDDDGALAILKRRLANGEITEDEYRRMKEILK